MTFSAWSRAEVKAGLHLDDRDPEGADMTAELHIPDRAFEPGALPIHIIVAAELRRLAAMRDRPTRLELHRRADELDPDGGGS